MVAKQGRLQRYQYILFVSLLVVVAMQYLFGINVYTQNVFDTRIMWVAGNQQSRELVGIGQLDHPNDTTTKPNKIEPIQRPAEIVFPGASGAFAMKGQSKQLHICPLLPPGLGERFFPVQLAHL